MVQFLKTKIKIKIQFCPLYFLTLSSKVKMLISGVLKSKFCCFMTKHIFH